jgi:hypothetical protein
VKNELFCEGFSCQVLVALTGFTDGTVRIWVLWVRDLSSHLNGSKSIVVKDQASGLGVWTPEAVLGPADSSGAPGIPIKSLRS